ncbi:hypothetical protein SAMD00019534_039050 [Acytostelium subglobosum LB1]|uniref:hypothetical protein n=1 Tax=Acytostelium subglobosum LB1 TaxID=1410327 RepID=UPI00064503BA|nr:hypothetical protein SAMD00019534_039050 [Acytostelium subglobosum LB1]GAM20730.1 hypothetical protein SAMD00019534_039050 [Acytostelium subglobosum LB1]|eukprot:XP_012755864.1 hypothetical protein SAMD00019534_039050 [Acytostelium subglobosum LB1]
MEAADFNSDFPQSYRQFILNKVEKLKRFVQEKNIKLPSGRATWEEPRQLKPLIELDEIRKLCSQDVFDRASDMFDSIIGVDRTVVVTGKISASGSQNTAGEKPTYNVMLRLHPDGTVLESTCECPHKPGKLLCQHRIAILINLSNNKLKNDPMKDQIDDHGLMNSTSCCDGSNNNNNNNGNMDARAVVDEVDVEQMTKKRKKHRTSTRVSKIRMDSDNADKWFPNFRNGAWSLLVALYKDEIAASHLLYAAPTRAELTVKAKEYYRHAVKNSLWRGMAQLVKREMVMVSGKGRFERYKLTPRGRVIAKKVTELNDNSNMSLNVDDDDDDQDQQSGNNTINDIMDLGNTSSVNNQQHDDPDQKEDADDWSDSDTELMDFNESDDNL